MRSPNCGNAEGCSQLNLGTLIGRADARVRRPGSPAILRLVRAASPQRYSTGRVSLHRSALVACMSDRWSHDLRRFFPLRLAAVKAGGTRDVLSTLTRMPNETIRPPRPPGEEPTKPYPVEKPPKPAPNEDQPPLDPVPPNRFASYAGQCRAAFYTYASTLRMKLRRGWTLCALRSLRLGPELKLKTFA